MKTWLEGYCHLAFKQVFRLRLSQHVRRACSEKIYMVDIDNTLADTWPSLKDHIYKQDSQRYRSLSVFIGMRRYLLAVKREYPVVFVSARGYFSYRPTQRWLGACGLGGCPLILVPRARDKIAFLELLLGQGKEVVFIDDLTYNHELGTVKIYEEVVALLRQMPLTYLDVNAIAKINSEHEAYHKDP